MPTVSAVVNVFTTASVGAGNAPASFLRCEFLIFCGVINKSVLTSGASVDDSDGKVGMFMVAVADVIKEYTVHDAACIFCFLAASLSYYR